MEEAERLCDRVAIVDQGKVIALGTPRELIATLGGEHVIEFTIGNGTAGGGTASVNQDDLRQLPSVLEVRAEDGRCSLSAGEVHVTIPALLGYLQQRGHQLASLTTRHASLEDVFVSLTGRHLQEEEARG
jgi:ABC-2 type transport system ATP-binding protein